MLTIPSLPETSFHTFSVADNNHQNNPHVSKLPPKSPITRLEYKGTGRKLSTFSTSQTDMVVRDLVPTAPHTPNVDLNKNSVRFVKTISVIASTKLLTKVGALNLVLL